MPIVVPFPYVSMYFYHGVVGATSKLKANVVSPSILEPDLASRAKYPTGQDFLLSGCSRKLLTVEKKQEGNKRINNVQ